MPLILAGIAGALTALWGRAEIAKGVDGETPAERVGARVVWALAAVAAFAVWRWVKR